MIVQELISVLEILPFKNLEIKLSSDPEGNCIKDIHQISDETDGNHMNPKGSYVIWPK